MNIPPHFEIGVEQFFNICNFQFRINFSVTTVSKIVLMLSGKL